MLVLRQITKLFGLIVTSTALALVGIIPAAAQQITGTPGSPSATTTIDGKYLPPSASALRRHDQLEF